MQEVRFPRSSQPVKALLILAVAVSCAIGLKAQTPAESRPFAEAIQSRIERARALVAAHQLESGASELESVRAATADPSVRSIASIMLMNVYLEAGNYGRAEALLEENFKSRDAQGVDNYFALAGQSVNGARTHLARYRSLGINTAATNLPSEAVNDLDHLRSFLERMIAQAREISNERKAYDSLSLLEDVLGIRLSLARDADEQAKWGSDYSAAREMLASNTQMTLPASGSALGTSKTSTIKTPSPYAVRRPAEVPDLKAAEKSNHPVAQPTSPTAGPPEPSAPTPARVTDFGLLNFKASKRVLPHYPPLAKQTGTTGLVRVHVVIDETGKVIEISHTEGPVLLRQVSEDAARLWAFEGIVGPGQTSPGGHFTGYIDFNFTL